MYKFWYNGTLNARNIGCGNFISTDIQTKRLSYLRYDTAYRERIEQAQRMAGYQDKLLLASRGGIQEDQIDILMKQTEKAQNSIKEITDETIRNSSISNLN